MATKAEIETLQNLIEKHVQTFYSDTRIKRTKKKLYWTTAYQAYDTFLKSFHPKKNPSDAEILHLLNYEFNYYSIVNQLLETIAKVNPKFVVFDDDEFLQVFHLNEYSKELTYRTKEEFIAEFGEKIVNQVIATVEKNNGKHLKNWQYRCNFSLLK